MCRQVYSKQPNVPGMRHLVELHDVRGVLLLVHLLLSLEQLVLAVYAAANAVILLLVQD